MGKKTWQTFHCTEKKVFWSGITSEMQRAQEVLNLTRIRNKLHRSCYAERAYVSYPSFDTIFRFFNSSWIKMSHKHPSDLWQARNMNRKCSDANSNWIENKRNHWNIKQINTELCIAAKNMNSRKNKIYKRSSKGINSA